MNEMLRSRLLRCSLMIALVTIGVLGNNNVEESSCSIALGPARMPEYEELWKRIEHIVVGNNVVERVPLDSLPDSTRKSPRERAAPALNTPQPTPPPQKRQDDGQIQALSSQLQSLSESATQAISSVSSSASSVISRTSQSAQSVRQSADQAVRSANQNADEANRQLSQTMSSASSAASRASAQASDQISRSVSSMSSRLASMQSSATSAISAAREEASSSAANAVNIAASQIQEARADASGVRGDANSIVSQVQSNSVSGTSLAIIVVVSVVGSAIVTALISYFIVRYRRKKRRVVEGEAAAITTDEKPYEKPIAVRGSPPQSPRFTPWGSGSGYPMDRLKLPTLSPFIKGKKLMESPSIIGLATSGNNAKGDRGTTEEDANFRLQKDKGSIKSATSVRIIRVGSQKAKANAKAEDENALVSVASPPPPVPARAPVPQPSQSPPSSPPAEPLIAEQPTEPPRATTRSSLTSEPEAARWTAPTRTTTTSQQRWRFRDSSDIESAEPTPISTRPPMRNTNTASLRAIPGNGSDGGQLPKNAGASFATFPRVRNSPPRGSAAEAIMNRGRPPRPGTGNGIRDSARSSREASARGPNWPFGGS
ncbi:hypothetical protein F4779DRAFT_444374 [Xylariaceae sp. FL0662B]|nr:hypothetical protein F4779DRAFT_444374 [Xylariaceae sp. FL0662B]